MEFFTSTYLQAGKNWSVFSMVFCGPHLPPAFQFVCDPAGNLGFMKPESSKSCMVVGKIAGKTLIKPFCDIL